MKKELLKELEELNSIERTPAQNERYELLLLLLIELIKEHREKIIKYIQKQFLDEAIEQLKNENFEDQKIKILIEFLLILHQNNMLVFEKVLNKNTLNFL